MAVIIADGSGHIDSAHETLVKFIPSGLPIVMVTWAENFQFNPELLSVKDYILICFCEYGYDWDSDKTGTHLWGVNSEKFPRYYTGDWVKFDNWVKSNPPKLTLKRELLAKDISHEIKPIDYTTDLDPIPVQSEAEFNSRPVSACYYFGRSHESRLLLHASIWEGASKYSYSVCDNPYQIWGIPEQGLGSFLQHERGKKYISMHTPHWFRLPMPTILQINGLAKIGVVPFGAGQKTFRHCEVAANSIPLMWRDELAWGAEWINGFNCFKCEPGEEVETIEKLTQPENDLYPVYLESVRTWGKYRTEKYIQEYLMPLINKA